MVDLGAPLNGDYKMEIRKAGIRALNKRYVLQSNSVKMVFLHT